MRKVLASFGIPLEEGADVEDMRELAAMVDETWAEFSPTSAEQAAATILEAIREGRWRVLIGEDARLLDEAVREAPEAAYEPGFPGPVSALDPMLMLRTRFAAQPDADLSVRAELRLGEERIAVCAAEGRLTATRGSLAEPDAVLDTDPRTLRAIVAGDTTLGEAQASGKARADGDSRKLELLLEPPRGR